MVMLILWGHALAALGFAALTLAWSRRAAAVGLHSRMLVAALAVTALWALAVAGIGEADLVTRVVQSLRNLIWLAAMLVLVRRTGAGVAAVYALYAATATVSALAIGCALLETLPFAATTLATLADLRLIARMLAAVGGLILVHQLAFVGRERERGRIVLIAAAIATIWGLDLLVAAADWGWGASPGVVVVRGFALTAATVLLAVPLQADRRGLSLSHDVAMRLFVATAIAAYVGATLLATQVAGRYAGDAARVAQTAIVLGATTALMTLLSTPWLRAWTKVKVAKHFFDHRYDYRAEWQRFTATLGSPGEGADPLDRRIVRAMAELTGSPAGLLLIPAGMALEAGAAWHWPEHPPEAAAGDSALFAYLAATGRIVALDQVRRGDAPEGEGAAVPAWMCTQDEAWALVPLLHGTSLIGAILLARPAVDRALDWEDLDLLRVAGRQAASYLAEDRAHAALADAARFDEFNRRFAFILHDIKNMVSGLSLVARNAERHADNPAFRADMVETLKDSAARMNALLARLSQHHRSLPEPLQPVDVAVLAARLAGARRAQHVIEVAGQGTALAQPGRLEQLLGHLLQNAVEASPTDAPITIGIATEGARVEIDVVDQGCGMSAAFIRDQLFRAFSSSKPDGFGLGAYEARELASAMGGTLTVTSREGAGTRFRVTLPAATALEAAA